MSIADHYGSFDEPEEKTEIEIIENPVLTATTLYELFIKKVNGTYLRAETMYQEATKLLE